MDKSKVKPSNFSGKEALKSVVQAAVPGLGVIKAVKAFNRKMDGKGSDYKPGTKIPKKVPAIEESLPNPDEGLV
tara:strand:+ start:230 stop:451 length:222 start_codon:yes stop_codon:yes gene_type:complete